MVMEELGEEHHLVLVHQIVVLEEEELARELRQ
jgi:hypothetical protein